jgi:cell division protein FtsI/penicillin-binding protein 2
MKEKNDLDIFEAFASLSKGTKRVIYILLFSFSAILVITVFRFNLLIFSLVYIYEHLSSFTPFITLVSTGLMVAYMFRNGQIMAYLKTVPVLIQNMFDKNKLETQAIIEDLRKQMFEMQSKQDDVSSKQKDELAKLENIVSRIESGNNLTHDTISKIKNRLHNLEKFNIARDTEIVLLKQQQNIILESVIKNGGTEKHS